MSDERDAWWILVILSSAALVYDVAWYGANKDPMRHREAPC